MIVAVRDSISGFTLWSRKCFSESYESILSVLKEVKERFGDPSGAISDMRQGIISALDEMFPNIPRRVCLFHFFRDLGSYIMKTMHLELGRRINGEGMKSQLKRLIRSIPSYDPFTLMEIEGGFCSSRDLMEIMSVRRILEPLSRTASSGYGFPFTLRHLNFYLECREAEIRLRNIMEHLSSREAMEYAKDAISLLSRVTGNESIVETAMKLKDVNAIFQGLRRAFGIPDHGKLSDDIEMNSHEMCSAYIEELEVFITQNIKDHDRRAAKLIIESYRKWESRLFSQNAEGTIPRTNNSIEQLFRRIRRNARKRSGNSATGSIITHRGESLAIFQNIAIPEYRKIVFGSDDMESVASAAAKYRKRVKKPVISRYRMEKLVDLGTKMILSDTLNKNPYTDEMMSIAYSSRGK